MYHCREMDVCDKVRGVTVDWLPLLMTEMLIREIFIDPEVPVMSQMCRTETYT